MNAVAERVEQMPAQHETRNAVTPMEMVGRAVANGASIEVVEKLMALHERWEANQARKSFDAAMSAAKAEIPVIVKNRRVGYEHKSGDGVTEYSHEDLGQIARTVDPILTKYGLSYRFRTTSNPNEPVSVTCIVAHRDGHSEENTLTAGRDDSGKKNTIQAVGSTITYLQRYTLKAALGLAAAADDDAKSAEPPDTINEQQALDLNDLIDAAIEEVGGNAPKVFRPNLLKYLRVESLNDLPARDYQKAVAAINSARPKK